MVLVTGGTGLVGAHLLLHLVENEEPIRAIYRTKKNIEKARLLFSQSKKASEFDKIQWIQADIIDISSLEIAFENIAYVYHCAALISFDHKHENAIRKTNIEGTANIVNFCLFKKVKKLCYVSSIAALGDPKETEKIITEETEWNPEKPHSDYAISKYGAEMEIWRGQQEGLNSVVVNPGVILGSRIWKNGSGSIFTKIEKGFPFYTKGSTGVIAVTDVARIMVLLMKTDISNERFTLISENCNVYDLFNSIADALKVKKPWIHINPLFLMSFSKFDWLISTIFRTNRIIDRATATASYSRNLYSNEKIKSTFSIEFTSIHQYIKEITSQ